jgi:hypothetical protein
METLRHSRLQDAAATARRSRQALRAAGRPSAGSFGLATRPGRAHRRYQPSIQAVTSIVALATCFSTAVMLMPSSRPMSV